MPHTPPMRGGVTILLSKSLPCSVEQVFLDPGERYVILILEMYAQRWAMVNVYIPPPFDPTILFTIFTQLALLQVHKIIVRGDFNAILDNTKDTSNPFRSAHPGLVLWADTLGLQELWRWKHPGSHIDLLFGSASTLSHVGAASYLLAGLSDHHPVGAVPVSWHLS